MTRPAHSTLLRHQTGRHTNSKGRSVGDLDRITDTDRRSLRPIGASMHEVAKKTDKLLDHLAESMSNVWIFKGVRPGIEDAPLVPHAVAVSRRLILVDSVAWPPGQYEIVQETGHIYCDGHYTGQSVATLSAAMRRWREMLPGHRVSAVVVVHPTGGGSVGVPHSVTRDIVFVAPHRAVDEVRRLLPAMASAASRSMIVGLTEASRRQADAGMSSA